MNVADAGVPASLGSAAGGRKLYYILPVLFSLGGGA